MNEQEKSLKLAELMGWEIVDSDEAGHYTVLYPFDSDALNPYSSQPFGLAQFAAILLKFPEVMAKTEGVWEMTESYWETHKPTQANILDEILAMNGVDIGD